MSHSEVELRNIDAFRRIIQDIINDAKVDLCDELMDPGMTIKRFGLASLGALLAPDRGLVGAPVNAVEGFKRGLSMLRGAFPDWTHEINHVVAKDDWVCGRWTLRCTHTGLFMGIAPTRARISMDESGMIRFRDGRMVEGWFLGDELSLLRQLGARIDLPGNA